MKRNYRLLVVIFFISVLRSEAQQIPDYLNCVKINQLAREACHNCYQKGDPNLPSISSALDLTGYTINAESTLVISPNATEFEVVFGFAPDILTGTNSPADSNGDDNLELVDPFGEVVDAFGVVGEDGSGTNHEFQNGRALRNSTVFEGNPVYTFTEWIIYNDTGDSGTINQSQNAPDDFTPGNRN